MLKTENIFQNGMVLQRDREVCIWGKDDTGVLVMVTVQGKSAEAVTDKDGNWKVMLGPLHASLQEKLEISDGTEVLIFEDVAVGEVWIGAGQSNMEFHMAYEKHFTEERDRCQDEYLRFYDVPEIAYEGQMEQFDYSRVGIWRKASPDDLPYFSAVGYYFAKRLRKKLNVPVAVIGCNWGGTSITAWLSRESLERNGKECLVDFEQRTANLDLKEYWQKQLIRDANNRAVPLEDAFSNFVMPQTVLLEQVEAFLGEDNSDEFWKEFIEIGPEAFPGILHEHMARKIVPYTVQGVLWYQGESDDTDTARGIYDKLLAALVHERRSLWENCMLTFLVVQLPGFKTWIGFAVVNFSYRLAPENKYPASLEDTNSVYTWVLENYEEYGFDTGHVFGVGDSAGAHNLGLYAAICTNPKHADEYDFVVPKNFAPTAIALNCGAYKIELPKEKDSEDLTQLLMADFLPGKETEKEWELIDVINHITENYPSTFFMTCPGDFLKNQASILAEKLAEKNVPFIYRMYGSKGKPLAHVFHCDIKSEDARICNDEECRFFKSFLSNDDEDRQEQTACVRYYTCNNKREDGIDMKTHFVTPQKYSDIILKIANETIAVGECRPERFIKSMKENIGSVSQLNPYGVSGDGLERKNPLVVVLGDSVTAGHFEALLFIEREDFFQKLGDGTVTDEDGYEITDARVCYPEQFRDMLIDYFEKTSVSVINSGIAGDTIYGMQKRLYRDVIRYQPDLVIINGSLNWDVDCGDTETYKKTVTF